MANEDGVWRTIGGRRIFIKDGQSLSNAMKSSGKFKRKNIEKESSKDHLSQEEWESRRRAKAELDRDAEYAKKQYEENGDKKLYDQRMETINKAKEELMSNKKEKEQNQQEDNNSKENKYTDKQLEMVWENEDSTEIYNHLTKTEKTKMRLAERDAYDGNESARQYVEKMNDEAAKRFLDAHKNDSDYEGYYMSDKYVAGENKKMDINDQKYNIEKSSGLKVEKAYQTDAYGTGTEDRFKLSDGRYVAHNLEDDSWSINKVSGGNIDSKDFKNYDDMLDHLSNSSSENQTYKKAFEDYKKKHPNSKITLNKFIDMSEGK